MHGCDSWQNHSVFVIFHFLLHSCVIKLPHYIERQWDIDRLPNLWQIEIDDADTMQIAYKFSINFNFSKEEVWSDIDFTAKSAENYYEICLINFSLINFDNIDV